MSHFTAWAIVRPGPDTAERIAAVMERYREDRDVPEHDARCWCVGRTAKNAAETMAEKAFPIARLRDEFARKYPLPEGVSPFDLDDDEEEKRDALWAAMLAPHNELERRTLESDPQRYAADPKCDECHGTGSYKTTSNPESRWDWYVIGGRWDGAIRKTPRSDGRGNYGDEHHELGNNSIAIPELLEAWQPKDAPFAVLTPDGEWHQLGRMGWFGFASDQMPIAEWREKVRATLADYPDHIAVALDCHI